MIVLDSVRDKVDNFERAVIKEAVAQGWIVSSVDQEALDKSESLQETANKAVGWLNSKSDDRLWEIEDGCLYCYLYDLDETD